MELEHELSPQQRELHSDREQDREGEQGAPGGWEPVLRRLVAPNPNPVEHRAHANCCKAPESNASKRGPHVIAVPPDAPKLLIEPEALKQGHERAHHRLHSGGASLALEVPLRERVERPGMTPSDPQRRCDQEHGRDHGERKSSTRLRGASMKPKGGRDR